MKIRSYIMALVAILATSSLLVQAQVPGVNSTLNSVFTLAYDNSTMKQTFSATSVGTPATTATDFCAINGSATKNIRVRRVMVSGQTAVATTDPVSVIKRSTVNTGGTVSVIANVPYDSSNSAATAIAEIWTANPVVGTVVGTLADVLVNFGNNGTTPTGGYTFTFGELGQPVVLRGASQQIAVSLGGLTYGSGRISCTFEWTEE